MSNPIFVLRRKARRIVAAAFSLATALAFAQVTIAPSSMPPGTSGVPYSQAFTASGGQAPYAFTNEVGRLPNGMTLSPAGSLTGTPAPATIPFEIWATDADGREAKVLAGVNVIAYALSLSPALPPGVLGQSYVGGIGVSGGVPPYTCTLVAGALPPGIALNPNCTLTGAPTVIGSYSFTVSVSDGAGGSSTLATTVVVAAAAPTVVPTLSAWAMMALALGIALLAGMFRRRGLR